MAASPRAFVPVQQQSFPPQLSSSSASVLVAVRVRPFNEREKRRKAQRIVRMIDGRHTELRDPTGRDRPRVFTFDHSYWSHDGFCISPDSDGYLMPEQSSDIADQRRVFDELGMQVLRNAWAGFNCALFAYGQTGSGKSYSMVGLGKNRGLVPLICEEMFRSIEAAKLTTHKGRAAKFQVTVSMFEIYCEKVRDLLSANATNSPNMNGGIKVREHPKNGFYVEGLSSWPVTSYRAAEKLFNEGTRARTIVATSMNASSSRAHTIVRIEFTQCNDCGSPSTTSEIYLVDLAGSERLKGLANDGERLREGIRINQSLSTLGRVIKALYDRQQNGKGTTTTAQQQQIIPYRDSVLTSLLKNALGGNSKTIMIATISPADVHYAETLSTLRFADHMKAIKTAPVVNESATGRLIRTIRLENERLLGVLGRGALEGVAGEDELKALRRQLADNQREMEKLERSWQQREETLKKQMSAMSLGELEQSLNAYREETPHLWNLNEDPALCDVIVHFVEKGDNKIGNGPNAQIQLKGLNILPEHALMRYKGNSQPITLTPLHGAEILVNGKRIWTEKELRQNDRIHFGANHLYVFSNRTENSEQQQNNEEVKQEMISYEMAQKEIATQSFNSLAPMNATAGGKKSKDELLLEEELVSLLPYVYRANAMAVQLKQPLRFEIVLMPPEIGDNGTGLTEIWIKAHDSSAGSSALWDTARFMSRYYRMQEMYQRQLEEKEQSSAAAVHADDDDQQQQRPVADDSNKSAPVRIGTVTVFLQRLLPYLVDVQEEVPIRNYYGAQVGWLKVDLKACAWDGEEDEAIDERDRDDDHEKPLAGRNMSITVGILSARLLPRNVDQSFCKYRFIDGESTTTGTQSGPNPVYSHYKTFQFRRPHTQQFVDYLKEGTLTVDVFVTRRAAADRAEQRQQQQSGGLLQRNASAMALSAAVREAEGPKMGTPSSSGAIIRRSRSSTISRSAAAVSRQNKMRMGNSEERGKPSMMTQRRTTAAAGGAPQTKPWRKAVAWKRDA